MKLDVVAGALRTWRNSRKFFYSPRSLSGLTQHWREGKRSGDSDIR